MSASSALHCTVPRGSSATPSATTPGRRAPIARITTFLATLETTGELAQLPAGTRPLCLLAHYHRYLRIFDQAQAASAIRYAKAAIAIEDHADDCWFTMGMVYRRQNKPHASLEALLHAIA